MSLDKLKSLITIQLFTIYLRYLLGGAFVFASIVKIQGNRFTTSSGINAPISDSWHLFETLYQSGLYWHFIGWGQLIAGFLLMTQLFSTLGAILFLPIMLNIFVITVSYHFGGTPIITFLMLLANVYLLVWDWPRLKVVVWPFQPIYIHTDYPFSKRPSWAYLGSFYFVLTIGIKLSVHSFFELLAAFSGACVVGLLVLAYNLTTQKHARNGLKSTLG
ncbi:hypothetical protein [Spirosoma utsteinense]|uniref:Membrane protein YphA (DoxX/SURF4 family) n=1 Tax=Spirosoma utsteinense TaxID=2585773 RepID=A0ABR6WF53_9BACT|nr:hypothetical protein [Spirosoma utsteinense]MBC3789227.1 putative membrane protein YphA (DoxX/SURF4 family) [Spirosoma utsteinense]MBC3795157.1 putative membrane protein YphA (DoxX/SURF4 family) [Spirosoma utsteinense]